MLLNKNTQHDRVDLWLRPSVEKYHHNISIKAFRLSAPCKRDLNGSTTFSPLVFFGFLATRRPHKDDLSWTH